MFKSIPLFTINGNDLYRERNLIETQIPILFVCKDSTDNRYLVLSIDFYDDTYLICPITDDSLHKMLGGEISMQEPFLTASVLYHVKSGGNLRDDDITIVALEDLDTDILPDADGFMK